MPEATMRNAADTYIAAAYPSTNYAAARRIALSGTTVFSFVYFSQPVPRNAIVTSAKLRLFYDSPWTTSTNITVQRTNALYSISRITWNNPVGSGGTATTPKTAPAGPAGTMIEIDVTGIMQTVANGGFWSGLKIFSSVPGTRWLTSAEGTSAWRPQLYVAWSEAPHAPTNLGPDGNDAVSMAKPTLRFDVLDTLGDTTIAAVQVQTSATSSFTAPAFDSGWVTTGDPELDLSTLTAPAFPGLTEGQSIYWRVRVKDGAGLASAWSGDAQLRRVSKGTLTILSPNPADVPPYVAEATPPIVWKYTGHTQVQWKVTVARQEVTRANPVSAVGSGKVTSTETQWTVPKGFINDIGPYQLTVQVWDDVDRDPYDAYAQQVLDFEMHTDPTVPPVTALAATQPGPEPSVVLTWQRATAPDSFTIVRDTKVIDSLVLPEESLVSGTSYRFTDAGGRYAPGGWAWNEHTYEVRAVVNGKQSTSSVVKITPKLRGIWLINSRGTVWLAGDDDGSWIEPEDATTLAPVESPKAVRLIQGVRNYEGSLAGQLIDAHGRTMADYEATLQLMRAHPTEAVRLAVADYSLHVILGNIQFAPTRHIPPSRLVTFDFWEV